MDRMTEEIKELKSQNKELISKVGSSVSQYTSSTMSNEPRATSTMKSTTIPSSPLPPPTFVKKSFASSVQKNIGTPPTPSQKGKLPLPFASARSSTEYTRNKPSQSQSVFKSLRGMSSYQNTTPKRAAPYPIPTNSITRPTPPSTQRNKTVSSNKLSGIPTNPQFPISSTIGRRSIPTRQETQSPFRKLYSSRGSTGTDISWSVSRNV